MRIGEIKGIEDLEKRNAYIEKVFGIEDDHLQKIKKVAQTHDRLGMQISASEGRILQSLVRWTGAQKIVEIGTLYGYSTLWMARGLSESGRIISLEKSSEHAELAKESLSETEVSSKVEIIVGDAEENLNSLHDQGPFDFVFIDANKGSYPLYLDWAEKNVKSGGLIVGDNTFLFGGVYGGETSDKWGEKQIQGMKNFNSQLANADKFQSCMIPTLEGMTIAMKRPI